MGTEDDLRQQNNAHRGDGDKQKSRRAGCEEAERNEILCGDEIGQPTAGKEAERTGDSVNRHHQTHLRIGRAEGLLELHIEYVADVRQLVDRAAADAETEKAQPLLPVFLES